MNSKRNLHKIPTADEVRAQGPVVLIVEQLAPDDSSLPPPRGCAEPSRKINPREQSKLEAVKRFGGLIPTTDGVQYWQCPSCLSIDPDRQAIRGCCGQIPNPIQICLNCLKTRKGIFRIGSCRCPPAFSK
jgi:hypothetical protein